VDALSAHGLVKRHGAKQALAGVSLRVGDRQLYGLIGADGSGKSSLLKTVAGVLSFDAGTLTVLGQAIESERDAERVMQRIGFMPQGLGLNLFPELSVDENIDFFAELRGVPRAARDERKARLLAMTRLDAFRARPMKQLSGGMKQKLSLICTLIHEPELVVLDEPTTGIDALARRDFWRLLPELMKQRRMTALIATAYLDEAVRFDRIGLLHDGRLLGEGPPQELLQQLQATVVDATGLDAADVARLAAAYGRVDRRGAAVSVMVRTRDARQAESQVRELARASPTLRLVARPPQLEDLFVARVAGIPATGAPMTAPTARTALPPRAAATREAPGVAIEARSLTRDFGAFRAADGVSFQVARGEIFGLLGANGAGKTTVIKMLTGILPPTSGVGQVAGADMRRASRQIRQRIGYMSQAFSLYADLRAGENLALYAGVYGLRGAAARERCAWVVDIGGLAPYLQTRAGSLPVGVRQRLALGCALLHQPQVLFLDEPTSGVDALGRRQFWNLLWWLARDEGVAILLSTHHLVEADLCDHLVLLFEGRVVADATPAQMKQQLQHELGLAHEPDMEQVFVHRVGALQEARR
jgi:ABC-2 type transport system ATP-binding protein